VLASGSTFVGVTMGSSTATGCTEGIGACATVATRGTRHPVEISNKQVIPTERNMYRLRDSENVSFCSSTLSAETFSDFRGNTE